MPRWIALPLLLNLALAVSSSAATITLNATDSGHYSDGGFHESTNENIIVGQIGSQDNRNFVVFDLSGVTETIVSARLELESPATSYNSVDGSEDLEFFDVTTPIPVLTAGGTLLTAIYTDLGSGTSYGGSSVSAADNGTTYTLVLNGDAVTAMNLAAGVDGFAIGGAITSLSGSSSQHFFSGTNGTFRRLVLSTVPEPGSAGLTALGLVALAAFRRRGR